MQYPQGKRISEDQRSGAIVTVQSDLLLFSFLIIIILVKKEIRLDWIGRDELSPLFVYVFGIMTTPPQKTAAAVGGSE